MKRALYLIQVRKKTVEEAAKSLGVAVEKIEEWISRVDQIMGMRHKFGKEGGQFRHVNMRIRPVGKRIAKKKDGTIVERTRHRNRTRKDIFPVPPVEKGDEKLAEMILKNFEKLSVTEKDAVMIMVDYFLETFSILKGTISFSGTIRANDFISALRLLGIQNKSLQLVDLSGAAKGTASMGRRLAWEKALGLKGVEWVYSNRGYGGKSKLGVIGIRVLSNVKEKMMKEGSYGFKYAMYILAIGYWS